MEIYRRIVSRDPSNLDAQRQVAELCRQENMPDEALKVYLQLGREWSAQLGYAEAKEAYQAVLRINPANSEVLQFIEHVEKIDAMPEQAVKAGVGRAGGHPGVLSRSICWQKRPAGSRPSSLPELRPFFINC